MNGENTTFQKVNALASLAIYRYTTHTHTHITHALISEYVFILPLSDFTTLPVLEKNIKPSFTKIFNILKSSNIQNPLTVGVKKNLDYLKKIKENRCLAGHN